MNDNNMENSNVVQISEGASEAERQQTLESYIKKLEDLEMKFDEAQAKFNTAVLDIVQTGRKRTGELNNKRLKIELNKALFEKDKLMIQIEELSKYIEDLMETMPDIEDE